MRGLPGKVVIAVAFYLMYCAGVQAVQTSSRAIGVLSLANDSTVLAVRFQVVFLAVLVVAAVRAWRRRSLDVFRPHYLFNRAGQAITQTGQTVCILFASVEMAGQLQSAVSMAVVPVWTLLVGWVLSLFGKHERINASAWASPLIYAIVASLLFSEAPKASGSVWHGIAFMLGSGLFTTLLHYLTDDVSKKDAAAARALNDRRKAAGLAPVAPRRESKLTQALWQNGPAAVLTVPLWFTAVPLVSLERASVPTSPLAVALLLGVAAFSLFQQLAMQLAYVTSEGTGLTVARFGALRGFQVMPCGSLLDFWLFHEAPGSVQIKALLLVPVAMWVGWLHITTQKKPGEGSGVH
ncbi:hypothetical protein [Rhizobacter sp. P5_C2]